MAFRVVKIANRCKLETQLNYLVCRNDKETRILLDEIAILLIENQQVCITTALISQLINHKIRVIFCDEKHNPQSELIPQHGSHNTYERLKLQIGWEQEIKDGVWTEIIRQKIENQSQVLGMNDDTDTYNLLQGYKSELQPGDNTNREGLAAKSYFFSLFGNRFDRREANNDINTYLNYGYSILLSAVNREVACAGYQDVLGIHHIGPDNPFNFGCDIMEPFRPFVDYMVVKGRVKKENFKREFANLLNTEIKCDGKTTILENAIHNFAISVFTALNSRQPSQLLEVTFLDEQL